MKSLKNWQQSLMDAVTDPHELIEMLDLDKNLLDDAEKASNLFKLKVPRNYIARMEKGNPNDPLLKQVLPIDAELIATEGFVADPLQEKKFNPLPGLLHKYQSRVLITFTGHCAINCRYCFRRAFPYEENNPGNPGWEAVLNYIQNDPSIAEVILSGGDPLAANDQTLKNFIEKIAKIDHITRLRIHSRVPVVLPERITPELIDAITHPRLKTILVLHSNHPREISSDIKAAMTSLKSRGVVLLNQTVLLKGVNDHVDTLVALSEALFDAGIQPYYLHLLDKVQGAAHFDLPKTRATTLHQELSTRLSGYLVPKLVCEEPGKLAKTIINPEFFCTN